MTDSGVRRHVLATMAFMAAAAFPAAAQQFDDLWQVVDVDEIVEIMTKILTASELPAVAPVDVGDALAGSGLVSHRALLHRDGTPVRRYAWQARRRDDDRSQQRLERSVVVINSSLNTTYRAGYSFSKKRKVQAALPTDYEDHFVPA